MSLYNKNYVIVYYNDVKHKLKSSKDIVYKKLNKRSTNGPNLITANGTEQFYENGKAHRDNDLPAVIFKTGGKRYYTNGVKYREIWPDGREEWYKNDVLHRDGNLPAKITADGEKQYFHNGKRVQAIISPLIAGCEK